MKKITGIVVLGSFAAFGIACSSEAPAEQKGSANSALACDELGENCAPAEEAKQLPTDGTIDGTPQTEPEGTKAQCPADECGTDGDCGENGFCGSQRDYCGTRKCL